MFVQRAVVAGVVKHVSCNPTLISHKFTSEISNIGLWFIGFISCFINKAFARKDVIKSIFRLVYFHSVEFVTINF